MSKMRNKDGRVDKMSTGDAMPNGRGHGNRDMGDAKITGKNPVFVPPRKSFGAPARGRKGR